MNIMFDFFFRSSKIIIALHYWKMFTAKTHMNETGVLQAKQSYWGTRVWYPCDLTFKWSHKSLSFPDKVSRHRAALSNSSTPSNIFLLDFNEKTLCSIHCMHFLIHSICHSISGHLTTLAGCAWPFQSVITIFLFAALSEHCIDRCWQGEVQMWRVLSSAIARIRFYTMSPAWMIDIMAIIRLHYSCQSRRTFYLMLLTLSDSLKAISDWIFETRVYFFNLVISR